MKSLLCFIALCSFFACTSSSVQPLQEVENIRWQLDKVNYESYFTLNSVTKSVHAFAGCNQMNGQYHLEGNTIAIRTLAMTEMYCEGKMEAEQKLYETLSKATKIVQNEDKILLYQGNTLLETFKKQTEQPTENLVNTRWVLRGLKGINNLGVAHEITLTLREGNKADGNAGCNTYFTTYKTENQSLYFLDVGTTRMFCQDAMNVENAFVGVLKSVNSYKIRGSQLTLLKDNEPLATFESVWLY